MYNCGLNCLLKNKWKTCPLTYQQRRIASFLMTLHLHGDLRFSSKSTKEARRQRMLEAWKQKSVLRLIFVSH